MSAAKPFRWASYPRDYPEGDWRHLVRKGSNTSLCDTTALPVSLWRSDRRKPECPRCSALAPGGTP